MNPNLAELREYHCVAGPRKGLRDKVTGRDALRGGRSHARSGARSHEAGSSIRLGNGSGLGRLTIVVARDITRKDHIAGLWSRDGRNHAKGPIWCSFPAFFLFVLAVSK